MRPSQWSRRRGGRNPLGTIAVLAAIALIAGLVTWLQPPGAPLSGHAQVVDGDTLRIGTTRIRLTGLDAVELDQTCINGKGEQWGCGFAARAFLAKALDGEAIDCTRDGRDRYGRVLAKCRAGTGDLGDAIVRAGWAVADLEYGLALVEARTNDRGIWSGKFDDPAEWRRSHGADNFDFWAWLIGLLDH
jgi:endonuclease YncB( thermonuclease family)